MQHRASRLIHHPIQSQLVHFLAVAGPDPGTGGARTLPFRGTIFKIHKNSTIRLRAYNFEHVRPSRPLCF